MLKPKTVFLVILAGTIFLPLFSHATEFIAECQDMEYVFKSAEAVVSGEVVNVESKREKGGAIFTYTDFRVNHYLKGKGDSVVTIKQFGGHIGNESQEIAGFPHFIVGQRGYLYLNKIDSEFYQNKFYGVVCGYGVTDVLPASVPVNNNLN